MAGVQLKSHYTSTAERAAVVRAAVPGVQTLGAIALNRAVGGINPLAVEIAAREGARTVWMPTVDAVNEAHEREAPPGREGPGVGQAPARAARAGARDRAGAGASTPTDACCRETREVLAMIAAPRDAAGDRPPRPRRDLRGRRRGARGGRPRDRHHPPRVPVPEPVDRGPARARRARRAARALLHDAAHRQDQLGAVDRRHPRDRAPSTRSCRPISARCSIRRSRTGWR